jgi:hypothetical protein
MVVTLITARTSRGHGFTFTLPAHRAQTLPELGFMEPVTDATVYVVDDDADVREALAWLLRSRSC